jgi:hypothetical protein
MQMLDVLKRLAELDRSDPRVMSDVPVLNNESKNVDAEKYHQKHEESVQQEGAEGSEEGKTQKYEMMLSNGKVKRFTAKDDADAKRIAKGHDAKSVIKMKGDIPGNKIALHGVAEVIRMAKEGIEECGMIPSITRMHDNHTPASINISADSGDELSAMLRDIMTLAGKGQQSPDSNTSIGEPAANAHPPAEVDTNGVDDMKMNEPTMMRSMIDKLNLGDNQADVKEYDNEPSPKTSGYASMIPTGNDLNSKGGNEVNKVNGGGNPYTKTMEQVEKDLFAEYRKFVGE